MGAAKKIEGLINGEFRSLLNAETTSIYGPIALAPLGQVLGVNFLGRDAKICTFDCVYCNLGPTTLRLNKIKDADFLPKIETVAHDIQAALKEVHGSGPNIDGILIAGNGEPTAHPDFAELVDSILKARELWLPNKPIILQTNGALFDSRKIHEAANRLNEVRIKIDCGNEKLFKKVNLPLSRANLARTIAGARKIKNLSIQSLFFTGAMSNSTAADVDDWIEVVAVLRPKTVIIQGMNLPPARPDLMPLDEDGLYSIASKLERKTQIRALVIP